MTILADSELLAGPFEGNGSVSQFTFNFRAFGSPEFVAVWVKEDAPGTEAEMLSHGVDYSVTQQPNAHTGRVNLLPSGKYPTLPTGYLIAIAGVFPEFQGIPFRASERFFAVRHEFAYDYTVNLIKQLRRDIHRVFDIPSDPFAVPRIWINGVTLEEYIRMLADAEVERAFAPKAPVMVTGSELFLDRESHRVPYILLNECTVYVPEGMPPGWTCDFQRAGGPVTFDTPEGMHWWSVDISKTIQHQYAWANLLCVSESVMSLSGDVYGKGNEVEPGEYGPGEFLPINGEWFYRPSDALDLRMRMALWDDPALAGDPHSLVTFTDVKGNTHSIPANNIDLTGIDSLFQTFMGLEHFNQYVGGWDTSRIRSFNQTFSGAESFNQPLDGWVTSRSTSFVRFLEGAIAFNQPLDHFDMTGVFSIREMLKGAESFNQPIGSWEFEVLEDMRGVLDGALGFNQPIGQWKVGGVVPQLDWSYTGMDRALANTSSFDQDLTPWCVSRYKYPTGSQPRPPFEFSIGSALQAHNAPYWGEPCQE